MCIRDSIKTVSTSSNGLADVVKAAADLNGKGQKAPYDEGNIDLTDKHVVEEAYRKRFACVNNIVKEVEVRKVLTKERNSQDKLDAVLTNRVAGLIIFAAIMFLVFYISQSTVGHWIAAWLVGWIETFQAVSYTQLDGYKRQVISRAGRTITGSQRGTRWAADMPTAQS